jgi:hypothetical protein
MCRLIEHALHGPDRHSYHPPRRYARNLVLVLLPKRQQVFELEAVSWPFLALVFCVVETEDAGVADWRTDDEDTELRNLRDESEKVTIG